MSSVGFGTPFLIGSRFWQAFRVFTTQENGVVAPQVSGAVWRPPQWNKPAPYLITLTQPNPNGGEALVTNYYFDAVLRSQHRTELRKTEQPTQVGANTVDHSYMLPAKLVLEIGMSDAMDRYAADLYTSNSSKSVSAYQTLRDLQAMRVPLTVTTRLDQFENMLIESITTQESKNTTYGLRAIIQLAELLTGEISAEIISARPQTTDDTPQGRITPNNVQLVPSHVTPPTLNAQPVPTHIPGYVPGAGDFSSYDPNLTAARINSF